MSRIIEASAEQFERLLAAFEARDELRATEMPDDAAALRVAHLAHERLHKLGWNDGVYCPKDGSTFQVCEWGSTGIYTAHYDGEWPKGILWIHDAGDLWPSHPRAVMWRPLPTPEGSP